MGRPAHKGDSGWAHACPACVSCSETWGGHWPTVWPLPHLTAAPPLQAQPFGPRLTTPIHLLLARPTVPCLGGRGVPGSVTERPWCLLLETPVAVPEKKWASRDGQRDQDLPFPGGWQQGRLVLCNIPKDPLSWQGIPRTQCLQATLGEPSLLLRGPSSPAPSTPFLETSVGNRVPALRGGGGCFIFPSRPQPQPQRYLYLKTLGSLLWGPGAGGGRAPSPPVYILLLSPPQVRTKQMLPG